MRAPEEKKAVSSTAMPPSRCPARRGRRRSRGWAAEEPRSCSWLLRSSDVPEHRLQGSPCPWRGRRERARWRRRRDRPVHGAIQDPASRHRAARAGTARKYSPAAMDRAPASRPETPVRRMTWLPTPAAPTPRTSARLDTSPSLAPKTAARKFPDRRARERAARARTTSAWIRSSARHLCRRGLLIVIR